MYLVLFSTYLFIFGIIVGFYMVEIYIRLLIVRNMVPVGQRVYGETADYLGIGHVLLTLTVKNRRRVRKCPLES